MLVCVCGLVTKNIGTGFCDKYFSTDCLVSGSNDCGIVAKRVWVLFFKSGKLLGTIYVKGF